jgi:hypothetical protein
LRLLRTTPTDVSPENDGILKLEYDGASVVMHERSGPMKQSKFSEEQIVYAIRQAESDTPVGDLGRQLEVSAG